MSVNLNNQVLYSCYLNDDNRWHDGIFKYSVVDNILQVSMKSPNRASVMYRRVYMSGMSRTYVNLVSDRFPYSVILFKDNGDSVHGFEFLTMNNTDSTASILHTTVTWNFNLADLGLVTGDKIKILIVGILPEVHNVLPYGEGDSAFDLNGFKDGHSRVYVHKSGASSYITGNVADDVNFELAMDDGGIPEPMTPEELAYKYYSLGVNKCVKEWFSHTLVAGNTPPDVGEERQRFTRLECNNWKVYISDLFGESESLVFSTKLYGSDTSSNATVYPADLDDDGCYEFTLSEDGLYEITVTNGTTVVLTDYIIEYCSLMTCYLDLVNSIYCNDLDCCTGCSDEVIRERDFKRNELLKLRVFMSKVTYDLNYLRLSSIGMASDPTPEDLERIADYWDKIKEIVDRCGTCSDSNGTSSECSQCN